MSLSRTDEEREWRFASELFGFHAHVAKLSKVLVKGRDWYVLSHRGGGDQAVDKVNLRSLIAAQSVQVDRHLSDLDARAARLQKRYQRGRTA